MASTRTLHHLVPRQSEAGSHRDTSNSASSIVSTLVPILLISLAVFVVFLLLRRKLARVYTPRSLDLVHERDRTPHSTTGMFSWLLDYKSLADVHILHHQSMDGYLFLRYLKMLAIMSLAGCIITWPILFPVNATGGGGQSQLDILSFANIATTQANRYYAHTFMAWIFLGFVVLYITHERCNYIGLRQAYYLSSFHAQRLSSRTVLFMSIPKENLSESRIRELLGPYVRKIWMVPDCKDLEELAKEKDKLWAKFEKAQTKLIMDSNKKRVKANDTEQNEPLKYVDEKKRPTHRLKPIIGKKVDTINHGRTELPRMWQEIEQKQVPALDNKLDLMTAAFVQFTSQAAAQEAYQLAVRSKVTDWNPRFIGVQPEEVIWKNLGVGYKSLKTKMLLVTVIMTLITIFWAIPVAFVGVLTNINYLTTTVPFLSFINSIPPVILGVVTGLLPAVLLAVLLALVPIICRLLAKFAGAPTLSEVELKTQSLYFVFLVVQGFLVTTFTSGAASVAGQIVNNPPVAVTLLAENLPKASNFYISFFLVQGLLQAALQIANIVPLLMIMIVYKFLDKTPRKMYNRWMNLNGLGWGSVYPKFTLLGVIALSYSCIAPLVLGFAFIGFALLYLGFRYNFLWVYGIKVNMKGQSYSRALKQLMTGVYLSIVCLVGLFAISSANNRASVGPLVLMIIFLVAVAVFQFLVDRALSPLEDNIPLDLLAKHDESTMVASRVEAGEGEHRESHSKEQDTIDQPWQPTTKPEERKPGFLTAKLRPQIDKFYEKCQQLFKNTMAHESDPHYTAEDIDNAYLNPALTTEKPYIWIPKDSAGLSKVFIAENEKAGLKTTDEASWIENKKIVWDCYNAYRAPIHEEKKLW